MNDEEKKNKVSDAIQNVVDRLLHCGTHGDHTLGDFCNIQSMECILFSHTHSKHSIADPDMCQRQTYFRISCVLAFFYDIDPDFSPFFYLIWGKYSLRAKGIEVIKERNGSCMEKVPLELAEAGEMRYLLEEDADTICSHTKAAYFPWGEEFLLHLLDNLQKAKRFIFLEYFIIERGEMWDCIEKVLEKKVKEGVEVRILYDSFGCTTTLPESDVHELTKKELSAKPLTLSDSHLPLASTI